ncbi:unnamed protein product [Amoebophrya sp. A25]|nr:unnamed protein product [Amoebophrya sp. A25]|eukprot:GSA25T00006682001.1
MSSRFSLPGGPPPIAGNARGHLSVNGGAGAANNNRMWGFSPRLAGGGTVENGISMQPSASKEGGGGVWERAKHVWGESRASISERRNSHSYCNRFRTNRSYYRSYSAYCCRNIIC